MIEFSEFPKIARLNRECVVTEKIDGTNASIYIPEIPGEAGDKPFLVGSRTRWITPEADNYGFAKWAYDHAETLLKLGPGHHFGEWWGGGVQRGYGLQKGEKRFSLFNTHRWTPETTPEGLYVVPIVAEGPFHSDTFTRAMNRLAEGGSLAAPGFMRPEGIVIFHKAGNILFKATFEKDAAGKGQEA